VGPSDPWVPPFWSRLNCRSKQPFWTSILVGLLATQPIPRASLDRNGIEHTPAARGR